MILLWLSLVTAVNAHIGEWHRVPIRGGTHPRGASYVQQCGRQQCGDSTFPSRHSRTIIDPLRLSPTTPLSSGGFTDILISLLIREISSICLLENLRSRNWLVIKAQLRIVHQQMEGFASVRMIILVRDPRFLSSTVSESLLTPTPR